MPQLLKSQNGIIQYNLVGSILADTTATLVLVAGTRYVSPTLTANRTKTFDSSDILQGQRVSFFNSDSAQDLILQDDASVDTYTLKPNEWVELEALVDAPSTAADWAKVDGSKIIEVLSSGTSWNPPAFIHRIWAEVYGGGGGGGGGSDVSTATATGGGGGGGGGVAEGFVVVTPGTSITYSIGTGGNGGATEGSPGSDGTNSTFDSLTGNAGIGALSSGRGSAGGVATGGDVNLSGEGGVSCDNLVTASVGVGGGGGSNVKGTGGKGGATGTSAGGAGGVFGGGGGGGGANSTGGTSFGLGGDGGSGAIILMY